MPRLLAANSVNYGKPYKMNTAEAMAACLYIAGFKEQARILLEPFGYGEEFIRLNFDHLELYSKCKSSAEAEGIQRQITVGLENKETANNKRKEDLRSQNGCIIRYGSTSHGGRRRI